MTPRPNTTSPLRSKTLIGMAVPVPVRTGPAAPSSAPPPSITFESPGSARAPATPPVRHNPLRSQTLIGIAAPLPPAPTPAPSEAPAVDQHAPIAATGAMPEPNPSFVAELAAEPAQRSAPPPATSVPTPSAAFARPAVPVVSESPPSSTTGTETKSRPHAEPVGPQGKRSGIGVLLLAAAGLAIGVGGYRLTHREAPGGSPDLAALPRASVESTPAAASPSAVSADTAPAPVVPAASATAADFPAAPPAPLDAPTDNAKAAPTASAAPATSAARAEQAPAGSHQVTINSVPPKAKFFHYGKQVGTAPFVVDLPEGERRAYEVWLPGHITRKVVIDGTKSEMTLGLREEPGH